MTWVVIFVVSALVGCACALIFKKHQALGLSALIPWTIFLILNLHGKYYSPDKEILQGTFVFFQVTIGSIVAVFGFLSAVCVMKLRGR